MVFRIFHTKDSQSYLWANSPFGPFWTPWDIRATKPTQPHDIPWSPDWFMTGMLSSGMLSLNNPEKNLGNIWSPIYRLHNPAAEQCVIRAEEAASLYDFLLCKICAANHQSNEKYTKRQKFYTLGRSRYILPVFHFNSESISDLTCNWKVHKSQPFLSVFNPKLCLYDLPFVSNLKKCNRFPPTTGKARPKSFDKNAWF